ncbi:MAG: UDP-3-O-acyl-N-acetylglucosamine deacetylase [Acetobacteraceae bacterium]|nr:UDP-3-O-acyl-N-acetylglucosamine deacetylase [Acetobacteraceae bacterium]
MDGFLPVATSPGAVSSTWTRQQTIKTPIGCTGVGLHSGRRVNVSLLPAPANAGIVFRRADLCTDIPARFDHVVDTRLCTVLGLPDRPEARVGTVEHLMAALHASGINNLLVQVDGPELPVLDGSAEPWLFLLDCAGVIALEAPCMQIEVLRAVRVTDGAAFAELRPGAAGCLELSLHIDFAAAAIGRQALSLALRGDAFREVARARTFAQAHEISGLRAAGLAQGGSLENAVVVDGPKVLNPSGLRMRDEFVRHKLLDAVGDLGLAGAGLRARFIGHRSGHALNNLLLRALFADDANWRAVRADGLGWMQEAA